MSTANPDLWRDPSRAPAERAADLAGRLTLAEKIGQLMMQCPAIPRLGIAAYDWWSEALHGVGRNGIATVFPQAIGLAATWSPELVARIASVISAEARAKHHAEARAKGATGRYQGLTLWSPNINLFRDPRWGRGQEGYGEDVCLTARMGTAFVRGLQGDDPRHLKTVATPKHFAIHNGPEHGRFSFNARVCGRDLWEEELSAFEFVIRDGDPWSVMSAYNAINGVPCAANRWLLTDLLRGRWGFRGAVVGDVDNVANLHGALKFTADAAESSAVALKAGQDLCSGWTFEKLGEAVARGLMREAELDENLKRNLEVRVRLGQFDPPAAIAYAQIPASSIDAPEHDALSLEAARQAVVLLKNNGVLPLDLSRLKTVAILGPTADSRAALLGNYSGEPARPVNLLQGLRRRFAAAGIKTIHYRAVPLVPGFKRQGNPLGESQCLFADPGGRMPGLRAEIFHNPDFDGSPAVVSDKVGLDLFWNLYQPIPPIPAERASIRWQGFVLPPATGPYQFALDMIGGVRLTVDGTVVLDQLHALDAGRRKSVSVTVPLQAGQPVPLLIELRQACTEGLFSLWWTTPLDPEDSLSAAFAAAADADHVILCLGLTPEVEGEEMPVDFEGFRSGDRTTIQLPAPQRELLAGAAKLGKPVTVILTTGSALTFDVGKADAILCAWYYGQRGGDAVAEILCGEVNPAGRLPVTFYGSDSDLPAIEDYSMAGRTYKHLRRPPLFAFGHGLSYSTFTYGTPRLECATVAAGAAARLTIPIKNMGLRDGDEVVQVYARDPQAGPERPICQLVGFQRQFIRKGETVDTRVALDTRVLRRWNEPAGEFVYDEGPWVLKIGPSSDCAMVEAELFLRSAP